MNIFTSFRQRIFARPGAAPASQSAGRLTWLWLIMSRSTATLYVRFGDWFAYLCTAGLIMLAALALLRHSAVCAKVPQVLGS